ncbi:hypothetical protein [Gluconobacter oxydans]|uniref:hypothetical protein n=1 Tax=Gluconobacter oxydans TaxID=442 RepID=UPI00062C8F8C|nr:hypothetical protein [Gluconobacter oxydans]
MRSFNTNIETVLLALTNIEEREKSLGTTRHIGNTPLAPAEIKRIVSLVSQELKAQGLTKAKSGHAYAEGLKKVSGLRNVGPDELFRFFTDTKNPVAELLGAISIYGWEQEDNNQERKGFGNALFVAFGLLSFRDWERYHGHSWDWEIQYVQWFARFAPEEFNAGSSIALHAHFDLGFSLLAEMKGKKPLSWSYEGQGGQP